MVNDKLLTEFCFDNSFSVVFPSRDSWLSQEFNDWVSQSLIFFADGSHSICGAGFGTYCPAHDLRSCGSLGLYCTIFQAELIALTRCAIDAYTLAVSGEDIILCTDSKQVLNSLLKPMTTSKLVKDCKHFINVLCSNNRVRVMWVPAHCNIEGNEIADALAKAGSILEFIGPEPAAPLTFNYGKKAIKNYIDLQAKRN